VEELLKKYFENPEQVTTEEKAKLENDLTGSFGNLKGITQEQIETLEAIKSGGIGMLLFFFLTHTSALKLRTNFDEANQTLEILFRKGV